MTLKPVRILKWAPVERPNLLSIRLGAEAEYTRWMDWAAERSWDLLLSYWQRPRRGYDRRAEMVSTGGVAKFDALHAIDRLRPGALRRYRAVAAFDDDIEIAFADVDRLFATLEAQRLMLAQPSLSAASYATFPLTRHHPMFKLHFTSFVEMMVPVFSQAAFAACVERFDETPTGFGLDHLWPRLLGHPAEGLAVIDDIQVTHTRPVAQPDGALYRNYRALGLDPHADLARLLAAHGLDGRVQLTGLCIGGPDEPGVRVRFVRTN